jgi:hypothetical protein
MWGYEGKRYRLNHGRDGGGGAWGGNHAPTTLMSSNILYCVNTAVTRAVWLLQWQWYPSDGIHFVTMGRSQGRYCGKVSMLPFLPIYNLTFSIKFMLSLSAQEIKWNEEIDIYGPVSNKIETAKQLMNWPSFSVIFTFLPDSTKLQSSELKITW